jgi:membrane protein DedA with SNARE-associated domain
VTSIETFLARYGLVALFLLATVEGDVSLIVGGVLAHLGLLPLVGVMVAGGLGNLGGDLVWFWMGRRHSERIQATKFYRAVGPRIARLTRRLGAWQLLVSRVIYGTRNASMLYWGQAGLAPLRFVLVDGLGCALAAMGFGLLGYLVGHGTSALTGEVKRVEQWLLGALVVGGVIVWGVTRLMRRELHDQD